MQRNPPQDGSIVYTNNDDSGHGDEVQSSSPNDNNNGLPPRMPPLGAVNYTPASGSLPRRNVAQRISPPAAIGSAIMTTTRTGATPYAEVRPIVSQYGNGARIPFRLLPIVLLLYRQNGQRQHCHQSRADHIRQWRPQWQQQVCGLRCCSRSQW